MIYDKSFFMGLAIVAGGLVLGGGALSLGMSTGGQSISLDAGFNESDAALFSFKCTYFTCNDDKCLYGGEYIASRGDRFRYGWAGKKHTDQDKALADFMTKELTGFTMENTVCDRIQDKLTCNPANRKISGGDAPTNKQLKEEFRKRASDGDMCFIEDKDDDKKATPTPTPKPSTKPDDPELRLFTPPYFDLKTKTQLPAADMKWLDGNILQKGTYIIYDDRNRNWKLDQNEPGTEIIIGTPQDCQVTGVDPKTGEPIVTCK